MTDTPTQKQSETLKPFFYDEKRYGTIAKDICDSLKKRWPKTFNEQDRTSIYQCIAYLDKEGFLMPCNHCVENGKCNLCNNQDGDLYRTRAQPSETPVGDGVREALEYAKKQWGFVALHGVLKNWQKEHAVIIQKINEALALIGQQAATDPLWDVKSMLSDVPPLEKYDDVMAKIRWLITAHNTTLADLAAAVEGMKRLTITPSGRHYNAALDAVLDLIRKAG